MIRRPACSALSSVRQNSWAGARMGLVRISIIGFNLPGSVFCRPDGSLMANVHVGVQHRRDPDALVRADSTEARWAADVDVIERNEQIDFRGPLVQGKRGDRFIYLTWGEVHAGNEFEMFRRAGDSSKHNYASGQLDHLPYFFAIDVERSDWEIDCTDEIGRAHV